MGLKINKTVGKLDIVAAVFYLISTLYFLNIFISEYMGFTGPRAFSILFLSIIEYGYKDFLFLLSLSCVIVHIVALVKTRNRGMCVDGNILGIIGHSVFFFFGHILSFAALVITIMSAIFTLKDNKLPEQHIQENR